MRYRLGFSFAIQTGILRRFTEYRLGAFKGVPGDAGLYWSQSTDCGDDWNGVSNIQQTGSTNGPSLTIANGAPMLAWKGVDGDSGLYYTTWNGSSWNAQNNIGGTGSTDRPALVVDFSGLPRLVWKGVDGDSRLYTSTLVGSGGSVAFWQPQQILEWIVAGNGGTGTVTIGVPGSAFGPSGATLGSRTFLVWRGVGDDQGLYFTEAQAGPGGQPPTEWSSQANIANTGTSHRPAVAILGGKIVVAWKGVSGDHGLYTTQN